MSLNDNIDQDIKKLEEELDIEYVENEEDNIQEDLNNFGLSDSFIEDVFGGKENLEKELEEVEEINKNNKTKRKPGRPRKIKPKEVVIEVDQPKEIDVEAELNKTRKNLSEEIALEQKAAEQRKKEIINSEIEEISDEQIKKIVGETKNQRRIIIENDKQYEVEIEIVETQYLIEGRNKREKIDSIPRKVRDKFYEEDIARDSRFKSKARETKDWSTLDRVTRFKVEKMEFERLKKRAVWKNDKNYIIDTEEVIISKKLIREKEEKIEVIEKNNNNISQQEKLLDINNNSSNYIITPDDLKTRLLDGQIPRQEDFFSYAEDVRAKRTRLPINEFVYKACEYSLDELVRSKQKSSIWEFNLEYAQKMAVYLMACRHVKDIWAQRKEYFIPEPWQLYMIGVLNGWRGKSNSLVKRYREFILECAKKQGKTFLAAAIGLYNTQLDAYGAEVYSAATKQEQAKLSWLAATKMATKLKFENLSSRLEILADRLIRDITNDGQFIPLAKETKSDEGINASFCIFDEAALIKKDDSITVLQSSMAARQGPQSLFITTPQHERSTLYYAKRSLFINAIRTNNNRILDRLFALIYCMDDNDDWHIIENWYKSNPNLGVSVTKDYLQERYNEAIDTPRLTNEVLIHHAGKWVGSASAWINLDEWLKNKIDEDILNKYSDKQENLVLGVDLATVGDLCGVTGLIGPFGKNIKNQKFKMFTKAWIPEIALEKVKDEEREIYDQAIERGMLVLCPGKVVDHEAIIDYIENLAKRFKLDNVGFDPNNATLIINSLIKKNINCLSINQGAATINAPIKKVEAWILNNQLLHDGDDFISWQLENTAVKKYKNDNVKLEKADELHSKIDNIISLVNAAACIDEVQEQEGDFKAIFVATDKKGMYWVDQYGFRHREIPGDPIQIEDENKNILEGIEALKLVAAKKILSSLVQDKEEE